MQKNVGTRLNRRYLRRQYIEFTFWNDFQKDTPTKSLINWLCHFYDFSRNTVTLPDLLQKNLKLHIVILPFRLNFCHLSFCTRLFIWSLTYPAFGVIMNSLLFLPLRLKSPSQIVPFPISYREDHKYFLAPRSNHKANENCQQCLVAIHVFGQVLNYLVQIQKLRNIKRTMCLVTAVRPTFRLSRWHVVLPTRYYWLQCFSEEMDVWGQS